MSKEKEKSTILSDQQDPSRVRQAHYQGNNGWDIKSKIIITIRACYVGVGKGVASSEVNLFVILDVGKSRFIIYAGRTH